MKEILQYIEAESMEKTSKWYVFEPMSLSTYKYFKETLTDYLTVPVDMLNGDKDFRYAHIDMYNMCILGGNVPERFKLGNSLHPGGFYFSAEDKDHLKEHFLKNRETIIRKILSMAESEEEFNKVVETIK